MMKISLVTVTYNSDKTLADCMDSVLAQNYDNYEYLVIDGGSTDNTLDLIKQYEERFHGRMCWVSEKDKGIYDAMNKGINMATGDVVGILNSDDYFTSTDVFDTIAENFDLSVYDAVYGDIHFIRAGVPDRCVRYYSSKLFRPCWLRFGFMPAHPSFYCKRSVFERYGLYRLDYKIGADYEMMVRLLKKHKIRTKYIGKDFVTMRIGGTSTRNVQSRITLIKEDVKACRDNGVYTNSFFISLKFLYKIFEFRLLG